MHSSAKTVDIINVRITHKRARVPLLEAVSFKNKTNAYSDLRSLDGVQEAVLIQTCNRIELYLVSEKGDKTVKSAVEYLTNRPSASSAEASKAVECAVNGDALRHLLRVTSGLESMLVGEDQILNQVWEAYLEAQKANAAGSVLSLLFNRAVNVGRRVRLETGINGGAVSVGSVAVELAENLLGSLNEKQILVIGTGEIGTLVAKAIARRCLNPIFIADRTYERAWRLAKELGGKAVMFDELGGVLVDADVVFCSTSAPHYLLTKELVSWLMPARLNKNALLIIDLSNPRSVEEAIKQLPRVKLYSIDDLTLIAERNHEKRLKNAEQAFKIVEEELALLERAVKEDSAREIAPVLLSGIEENRQR